MEAATWLELGKRKFEVGMKILDSQFICSRILCDNRI